MNWQRFCDMEDDQDAMMAAFWAEQRAERAARLLGLEPGETA